MKVFYIVINWFGFIKILYEYKYSFFKKSSLEFNNKEIEGIIVEIDENKAVRKICNIMLECLENKKLGDEKFLKKMENKLNCILT